VQVPWCLFLGVPRITERASYGRGLCDLSCHIFFHDWVRSYGVMNPKFEFVFVFKFLSLFCFVYQVCLIKTRRSVRYMKAKIRC